MHFKRLSMIMFAFIGLITVSLSIDFAFQYLVSYNQFIGLIIGVVLMIISIIMYQFGEKNEVYYQIVFVMNMIAVGLSITSYYVFKAYSLTLIDFIVAISISLGVLTVFALLSKIEVIKKHHKLFLAFFIAVSFIISLSLWLSSETFTGLTFYFLNVAYFFMIGIVSVTASFKDISKEMAWISFGAFILISIIVLIIISEGEALSGLDGVSFDISSKKKKKRI